MAAINSESFTQESVISTLAALRRQEGNSLVSRVLAGNGTFSGELADLFYFFNGAARRMRNSFVRPSLRSNHDTRLGELEQALNAMSLMTYRDDAAYLSLGIELERVRRTNLLSGNAPELGTDVLLVKRKHYEYLSGHQPLGASCLYEKNINTALNKLGKNFQGLAAYVVFCGVASGFAYREFAYVDQRLATFAGVVGALCVAGGLVGFFLTAVDVPTQYRLLSEKATRADAFVQQHSG